MMHWTSTLLKDQRGATAVEYGLIASLVVLAMVVGLSRVAGTTSDMWQEVSSKSAEARNR